MSNIFDLILNQNIKGLKKLLEDLPTEINSRYEGCNTLIFAVICTSNIEIMDLIIDKIYERKTDFNINSTDSKGYTPLNWAITLGKESVTSLLLKNNQHTWAMNKKRFTHLYSATLNTNYLNSFCHTKALLNRDLSINPKAIEKSEDPSWVHKVSAENKDFRTRLEEEEKSAKLFIE